MSEYDNRWDTVENVPQELKVKKAMFMLGHFSKQAEQFLFNTNNGDKPFLGEECFELFLENRNFKKLDGEYKVSDFANCNGVYQEYGFNPKNRALPYGNKIIAHLDNWRPDYWVTYVESFKQLQAIDVHSFEANYCSFAEKVTGRYVEVKGSSWIKNTDYEAMKQFSEMLKKQNEIDSVAGKGTIKQIRAEFVIQFHPLAESSWYAIQDLSKRKDWKPNLVWNRYTKDFDESLINVETYAVLTFDELEKLYIEAGENHLNSEAVKSNSDVIDGKIPPIMVDSEFQEILRRDQRNKNSYPQKKNWSIKGMKSLGYEDYEDIKFHRRLDLSKYLQRLDLE